MTYEVILPPSWHEVNTPARGYLEEVVVRMEDGRIFKLTFIDHHNNQRYRYYFDGQRVIVVDDVNEEIILAAIRGLAESGQLENT
jgi:hypothetical protein